MAPIRFALAGATGNLGIPILETLLDAQLPVTVLSRVGGTNSSKLTKYSNLVIKKVDFNDSASIRPALEGISVVISCVATLAMGSQNALIDASCAAGVQRFIPAEFGMDSLNPFCAELPVCHPKVATQKYLADKAREIPTFTWTGIAVGLFLDWGLDVGFILNPAQHTGTLYNGGGVPFSSTTLADIGKAVLGVIRNQEKTANRLLYVQSATVTQKQLIQYAKDKDEKEWSLERQDTDEVLKDSFVKLDNHDDHAAMLGFSVVGMWDPRYGGDFSKHLDNELLGLKELDDAGLRRVVEGTLK